MSLTNIKTFLAVVETGSLKRASERLNVTQSTVTARLDALENELRTVLLVRSRRGAELTKSGFVFLRHAELLAQTWDVAARSAALPDGLEGRFSLACDAELWDGLGERVFKAARTRVPGHAMEAWPGEPSAVQRWLASGLSDAAIVSEAMTGQGIQSRPLVRERLVQVATQPRAAVDWSDDYVFVDYGPAYRRQHAATWPTANTARFTFGSGRWALNFILENGGSAYLPIRLAAAHIDAGELHSVTGSPELSSEAFLIWREEAAARHPWLTDPSVGIGANV